MIAVLRILHLPISGSDAYTVITGLLVCMQPRRTRTTTRAHSNALALTAVLCVLHQSMSGSDAYALMIRLLVCMQLRRNITRQILRTTTTPNVASHGVENT